MSWSERDRSDVLAELRFALEEGYAESPPSRVFDRVYDAALESREPGRPVDRPEPISGPETLAWSMGSMEALLVELAEADWARPALRGLDVQGLLGHLIGVEESFIKALSGGSGNDGDDHVGSTQPYALAQAGRAPSSTLREWQLVSSRSAELISSERLERPVAFYGVVLPLDQLLVIRAFEMWIHEEDIRRATDRLLHSPDPEPLARMAELAVALLPAGVARAGLSLIGQAVRLVLTGPAGGAWTVTLDGTSIPSDGAGATVVVDTTAFCRVVGNRLVPDESEAWIDGDRRLASDVFIGAAALALD